MSGPRAHHPHADVIHAWADGAKIQSRWLSRREEAWADDDEPRWFPAKEYRVKPATIRYRVALVMTSTMPAMSTTATVDTADQEQIIGRQVGFLRWLGDWQEVEL